jgi:hypothetical protein
VSRIRRDVVVIVVSLAVFAVCAVVAANGRVGPVPNLSGAARESTGEA